MSEGPPNEPGSVTLGTLDPNSLQPEGPTVRFEKGPAGHWPTLPSSDGRTVIMGTRKSPAVWWLTWWTARRRLTPPKSRRFGQRFLPMVAGWWCMASIGNGVLSTWTV